jgi:hypothetical protein
MLLAPLPRNHAIVYFAIKLFDQSVTLAGETLHTPIVKRKAFFAVKAADFSRKNAHTLRRQPRLHSSAAFIPWILQRRQRFLIAALIWGGRLLRNCR